jgi:hypothetical protein
LQGANHCLASLAGIVGPTFFGWLYALTSTTVPGLSFAIASAMILVALICGAVATAPSRAQRSLGKG